LGKKKKTLKRVKNAVVVIPIELRGKKEKGSTVQKGQKKNLSFARPLPGKERQTHLVGPLLPYWTTGKRGGRKRANWGSSEMTADTLRNINNSITHRQILQAPKT